MRAYIHHLYADPDDPKCRGRYILLVIHESPDQLQVASDVHEKHRGATPDGMTGAVGMFQPSPFRSECKRRKWIDTTTAFAGVLRLSAGHLTGEVIAHESAHAALHITRLHQWSKTASTNPDSTANLGPVCSPTEEAFCYLLGGIAAEVNDVVRQYLEKS